MSEWHVEVVRVDEIIKHPNADQLGIVNVGLYPVIVKLDSFKPGDLGVYIPVDSCVNINDPRFNFLDKPRIKAKRLRGVFSQGLLIPAEPGMNLGDNVAERLGITKYLTKQEQNELQVYQPKSGTSKRNLNCPPFLPRYTDIENLRRHPNAFAPGQTVIVMEKVEGSNGGYAYVKPNWWTRFKSWLGIIQDGPVICRSRNQRKYDGEWFELIDAYDLQERFEQLDDPERYSVYGEHYGHFPGFDYGTAGGGEFIVFDVWDRVMNRFLDYDDAYQVCEAMGLEMVPVLYRGPYDANLIAQMAEGQSTIGEHIKEGVIVRPERETFSPNVGRLILKIKGQDYLLRKEKE